MATPLELQQETRNSMEIRKVDHIYFTCSLFIPIYLLTYAVIFWFEQNYSLGTNIKFPPLINSMGVSALVALVMFPIAYKRYFKKIPNGRYITLDRTLFTTMSFITLALYLILLISSIFYVIKLVNEKNTDPVLFILFIVLFCCIQIILISLKIWKYLSNNGVGAGIEDPLGTGRVL